MDNICRISGGPQCPVRVRIPRCGLSKTRDTHSSQPSRPAASAPKEAKKSGSSPSKQRRRNRQLHDFERSLRLDYSAIVSSFALRVAAALVASATALLMSSCSSSPAGSSAHTSTRIDEPVITGEPAAFNTDDVAFASSMLPSEKQVIDISQRVPDHSNNPQIVAVAAKNASTRQTDIQFLKALRAQWGEGPDDKTKGGNPGATPGGVIDDATIAKLDSLRGNAFDTLWLKSMISLDQGAIEMANAEISKGKNVDAVTLAKQIVKAAQADRDQMQQLLAA
jgi:uncharacterized protein (DUF305 family)